MSGSADKVLNPSLDSLDLKLLASKESKDVYVAADSETGVEGSEALSE